ncbi:phenoloxidase-activating factor 2-like [Anopheles stephensi]|uniref:phenoloxidase-activating factor 2-like n=1 Tax=Anopheles stephensi TaxID=30069 RepID=UPI001658A398|nr:phenoloxidase-activating factor 2-like [Anopheles stephensi]
MKLVLAASCVLVLVAQLPIIQGQTCQGKCIPIGKCNRPVTKIEDENAPPEIDLRVGQENSNVVGECPHYLDVCCAPGQEIVAGNGLSGEPNPQGSLAEDDDFLPCGNRNANGVGFRIGAGKVQEAEFGEFPWTLLVLELQTLYDFEEKEVYACVASLLAPNVALTVAHCVSKKPPSAYIVRAGEWDIRTENEVIANQDSKVKQVLLHDRYNNHHHFDVALLVLEKPFRPADNVQIICLPPPGLRTPVGTECITGGWGKDRFGDDGTYQEILKRVTLPIIDSTQCERAFQKTRLGLNFKLHNSFLCAGGKKGADVCSGDGGAALVCLLPGSQTNYYQAGAVAWGIGCGDENIPGAYADIEVARSWIVSKLNALKVDPTYYTAS